MIFLKYIQYKIIVTEMYDEKEIHNPFSVDDVIYKIDFHSKAENWNSKFVGNKVIQK